VKKKTDGELCFSSILFFIHSQYSVLVVSVCVCVCVCVCFFFLNLKKFNRSTSGVEIQSAV
jgi:NO-binding membrane sensor protein with MHYT domain